MACFGLYGSSGGEIELQEIGVGVGLAENQNLTEAWSKIPEKLKFHPEKNHLSTDT